MTELPTAWERPLRAGPPDESGYVARPILDPSHQEARADGTYLALERVVPQTRSRLGISTTHHGAGRWVALSAAASLAIGLLVGRTTAPVTPGGALGPSEAALVRPAFVADGLMKAWTRATINLNGASTTWMVCVADPVLACDSVAAIDLGSAANSARGGLSPSMPVRTYWSRLHPATIGAGHVAGAFAIAVGGGQIDAVDARFIALDGPANSPGVQIETVASGTHGWFFFDLGTIASGSYGLVIATNPTSAGSELYAAGLIVRNP
jgi:hypothetical protein